MSSATQATQTTTVQVTEHKAHKSAKHDIPTTAKVKVEDVAAASLDAAVDAAISAAEAPAAEPAVTERKKTTPKYACHNCPDIPNATQIKTVIGIMDCSIDDIPCPSCKTKSLYCARLKAKEDKAHESAKHRLEKAIEKANKALEKSRKELEQLDVPASATAAVPPTE